MLSAAMIVKNEVKTLEQTIYSVKDHVDEIVIGLDVESNDGTGELAEKLATKVVPTYLSEELRKKGPRKKKGDWGFSKARNIVLNACDPKNWRMTLDGHEVVHQSENLSETIEQAMDKGCDGVEIPIRFEPDQFGIPSLLYNQARLFAPSVRYRNPIHNVPAIQKTYTSDLVSIEHRKKDQDPGSKADRDKQRSSSTIEGLLKKVKDAPEDPRSWFYLGNSYKENARYREAIPAYEKYLTLSKWREERWHARVNMGTCHSYLGDHQNAREQFSLALEEFPAMAEAYYYLADLAYKRQRFREAQVWLEKCVELDIPKCTLFVTPKIYLVDRYDLLSMVYHHLGLPQNSIEQAEKALAATNNPRIRNNIEFWKKSLRRT